MTSGKNRKIEESFDEIYKKIEVDYPLIRFSIKHENLIELTVQLIEMVFTKMTCDDWEYQKCTDGVTNKRNNSSLILFLVVKCTNKSRNFSVLVRTYGKNTELIVDRRQELAVKFKKIIF